MNRTCSMLRLSGTRILPRAGRGMSSTPPSYVDLLNTETRLQGGLERITERVTHKTQHYIKMQSFDNQAYLREMEARLAETITKQMHHETEMQTFKIQAGLFVLGAALGSLQIVLASRK